MWLVYGKDMYKANIGKMEFELIKDYNSLDYEKYARHRNPSNRVDYTRLS